MTPFVELPSKVVRPATTETPPKAGEIHVVKRDWGAEISWRHRDRIERVDVCAYGRVGVTPIPPYSHTPILDLTDGDVRLRVAAAIAALDAPVDRRAELQRQIADREEEITRLRADLAALPAQGEGRVISD